MRFIVVTCCALVVVKSASIRDKFIVTPQNFSSPSENFIYSSQQVKLLNKNAENGQAVRPFTQNVKLTDELESEEVIYAGLNGIRNKIESGNEKLNNEFWKGLNNSVQEFLIKHKHSNKLGSEFQSLIQEKVKNQQGLGQSIINFFTEGVSNIVNNLGGAPQQSQVPTDPQVSQPLDDIEIDTTQRPNFISNVVNSVQQVFQPPQPPQQTQFQQAQPQAQGQLQPVQYLPNNQPVQDASSTQRPNFLSNVVNSVQQAFKPTQQPQAQQAPLQQAQSQVPVQQVQNSPNNQPPNKAPTSTHRPNFLSNVANSVQQAFKPQQQLQAQQASLQPVQPQVSVQPVQLASNQPLLDVPTSTNGPNFLSNVVNSVQQAFKPPQQAQPQQASLQQAQLQVPAQPIQPSPNNQAHQTAPTSTHRPNFLSNVVNSVQQALKPPQQVQPQQTQLAPAEQAPPQQVQASIQPTQPPLSAQSTGTEHAGFLSNVVGQVQQAFQRPQPPVSSTPSLDFVEAPQTTTTTQNSLLQNIGQVIQGFRPQTQPTPAPPQIQETLATTTPGPNIFQNIGQAIQGLRPQPSQASTTSVPTPKPNQVQQVVASSSQVTPAQNNNLQNAIAEVAACIVKTRIDNLVEQSKHKMSGEL